MKSLLEKINIKLNAQGGFFKSVSMLVGGTAFAQGLMVLALPFLTRLYTPAEFSMLAVYMSLIGILAVASNLRFEIAIPLPKNDIDALSLLILAVTSNIIFSILAAILIFLFKADLVHLIKQPNLEPYLWLIPIGIFFSSFYNSFQFWVTRKKQFKIIAISRISQSFSGIATQLLLGILGVGVLGLFLGHILNLSAGILNLIKFFIKDVRNLYKNITYKRIILNLKEYQNFPKYSTFEALTNNAGIQLPILIIATVAIGPEAGYLMLATRVMAIPVRFIGSAVSQVFLGHAPEQHSKGQMKSYTLSCVNKILKIGGFPLIIICLISPLIFPYIFGAEWKRAGEMVLWMLPWFLMQLMTSPVSLALHIVRQQKVALILQIFGFILRAGGLLIIAKFLPLYVFEYYAISGFIFYLIYFLVIMYNIHVSDLNKNRT